MGTNNRSMAGSRGLKKGEGKESRYGRGSQKGKLKRNSKIIARKYYQVNIYKS